MWEWGPAEGPKTPRGRHPLVPTPNFPGGALTPLARAGGGWVYFVLFLCFFQLAENYFRGRRPAECSLVFGTLVIFHPGPGGRGAKNFGCFMSWGAPGALGRFWGDRLGGKKVPGGAIEFQPVVSWGNLGARLFGLGGGRGLVFSERPPFQGGVWLGGTPRGPRGEKTPWEKKKKTKNNKRP